MPTIQSATARLSTKQLVTVRRRRVVMTDSRIRVLPSTVIMMTVEKKASKHVCGHVKVANGDVMGPFNVVVVVALALLVDVTLSTSETVQRSSDVVFIDWCTAGSVEDDVMWAI